MCLYHSLHSCSRWWQSPSGSSCSGNSPTYGLGDHRPPTVFTPGQSLDFSALLLPSFHFLWVSLPSWLPHTEKQNHHCHYCAVLAPHVHHWDFCMSLLPLTAISGMHRWDISASQGNEGGVLMGVKHNVKHKKIIFVCHLLWKLFNSWQLS